MILEQNWPKTAKSLWHCSFKLKGLWASVTLCDLNSLWRLSEVPLMDGTELYIFFSLTDSLESLEADPVFGIVSIQSG